MFLNVIANFKEARRLKAIFEGDITPRPQDSHVIAYPEGPDRKDLLKKLIRYYYLTDHQVPTGKVEAALSKDLPELEHEYLLPMRAQISGAIVDCRNRMREGIRKKNIEAALGGLFYAAVLALGVWKLYGNTTAGKAFLTADLLFGAWLLILMLKSATSRVSKL